MPPAKLAPELGFPLTLDRGAHAPLQQQLREHLRQAMLDGRLAPGTRLPSTRALAQALGVSRTVTSAAYDELFAEGYLEGRQGSGTYVGSNLAPLPPPKRPGPHVPPRWLGKNPLLTRTVHHLRGVCLLQRRCPAITSRARALSPPGAAAVIPDRFLAAI